MRMQCNLNRSVARIAGAALAAVLLLTSPIAPAKKDTGDGEQWSAWEGLDRGYVGRRKQPPKLDRPAAERRLDATQPRLREKAARRAMREERRAQRQTRRSARQARRGASNTAPTAAAAVAATAALEAEACHSAPVNALTLRTTDTGLYSVSVTELAAELGKSTDRLRQRARRGTLALTSGSPVAWHYDAETGSLLFAAEAVDSFYTDEKAFRFSLSRRNAKPMTLAKGAPPGAGQGEAMPFTDVRKEEEEPDLWFIPWAVKDEKIEDYWFWTGLFGPSQPSVDLPLQVPSPAPTATARISVHMHGATDLLEGDDHRVTALLVKDGLEVELGIVTWDGFEPAELTVEIDNADLLDMQSEAGEVTLRLVSDYPAGTSPWELLDKVEIEYLRAPVAENGVLWMRAVTGGMQSARGFSTPEILVVENPNGAAVLRNDARVERDPDGGYRVTLHTEADADYLISERSAIRPVSLSPDYRSTLRKRSNTADYLIVAPREFACTAKALAEYRSGRYPDVQIAWVEDIMDEFNNGQDDPVALARFADHVINKWRRTPQIVQMIGKATLDHKGRMGYQESSWPTAMTSTPWSLAASLDRTLGIEGKPPFATGSLPIVNDAEGQAYVRKLEEYETTARDGSLLAAFVADNPDKAGNFHANIDALAGRAMANRVNKYYHPDDDVRSELTDPSFWGTFDYVTYDGHGSTQQAGNSRENFIKSTDAEQLQNSLYPIFAALSCAIGDDSMPAKRSLAAALVLNASGGAVASMVPSGLSLDAFAQILGTAFVDQLLGENMTIGEALRVAKQETDDRSPAFMPAIYSVVGEAGVEAAE